MLHFFYSFRSSFVCEIDEYPNIPTLAIFLPLNGISFDALETKKNVFFFRCHTVNLSCKHSNRHKRSSKKLNIIYCFFFLLLFFCSAFFRWFDSPALCSPHIVSFYISLYVIDIIVQVTQGYCLLMYSFVLLAFENVMAARYICISCLVRFLFSFIYCMLPGCFFLFYFILVYSV